MQDRPTYDELLAAVEQFLDTEIVPNVPGSRGFHARVAANAIRIVRRELSNEEERLAAEWSGLDAILGSGDRGGLEPIGTRVEGALEQIQLRARAFGKGHAERAKQLGILPGGGG
ncbi:MAG: hypothetical protein IH997_15375 [Proteobacteria bacterium]|nr:hypothetical protein [Pseudomonadota bacterium]